VVPGALLSAHYRAPLDWTDALLEQSRKALDRIYGVLQRAKDIWPAVSFDDDPEVLNPLLDDLNTPAAISQLFKLSDDLDRAIREGGDAATPKRDLLSLADMLGVLHTDPDAWFEGGADDGLKAKVEALLEQRKAVRAAKDWPAADAIRAQLDDLGVVVMDGPQGATWRMK